MPRATVFLVFDNEHENSLCRDINFAMSTSTARDRRLSAQGRAMLSGALGGGAVASSSGASGGAAAHSGMAAASTGLTVSARELGKPLRIQGWLWKKGEGHSIGGRRNWKLRFFKLDTDTRNLTYQLNEGSKILGTISMKGCDLVDVTGGKYEHHFQIRMDGDDRVYNIRTQSAAEYAAWRKVLLKATEL